MWQIDWPNTLVGETATVPCGVDFTGNHSHISLYLHQLLLGMRM